MKKNLIVTVLIFVTLISLINLVRGDYGTVKVEGYAHAIALCEYDDLRSEDMMTQGDEFHTWTGAGITYVVNYGHLNDPQVGELEKLAHSVCAQYFNN